MGSAPHNILRLVRLFSLFLIGALAFTTASAADSPVRWSDGDGKALTFAAVAERASSTRIVLLGEVHDNPAHHAAQADILRTMVANGRRPAVVMEMIGRARQPAIDGFRAGGSTDAEAFAGAVGWAGSGWPDFAIYRPIIAVALAFDLPIVAGDLDRQQLMAAANGGPGAALGSASARWNFDALYAKAERDTHLDALDVGHCHLMPRDRLGPMVDVQIARDASLAVAVLEAAGTADGAVLIAGNGHVRADIGVPKLLAAAGAGPVLTVSLSEAWTAGMAFDLIGVTAPVDRPDPCAQLREHFKPKDDEAAS